VLVTDLFYSGPEKNVFRGKKKKCAQGQKMVYSTYTKGHTILCSGAEKYVLGGKQFCAQ
jgi:hypothetical protein